MATNMAPHNLGEVVDALVYMIDRYEELDDVTSNYKRARQSKLFRLGVAIQRALNRFKKPAS